MCLNGYALITLEPTGGVQISNADGYSFHPAISFDKSAKEWGVIWLDYRMSFWEILYGRLGLDDENALTVENTMMEISPLASFDSEPVLGRSTKFISLWNYLAGSGYIYSIAISNDGAHSGSSIIDFTGSYGYRPSLVASGGGFGAAWVSENMVSAKSDIIFATLDSSGAVSGTKKDITSNEAGNSGGPSVAWTGSKYGICWHNNKTGIYHIYYQRLDSSGTAETDIIAISPLAQGSFNPRIVWTGYSFFLCWEQQDGSNSSLYYCLLDTAGNVLLGPYSLSSTGYSHRPCLCWTGKVVGIFWQEGTPGNSVVYYASIDALGKRVVNPASVVKVTSSEYPDAVWSDFYYVLAWQQGSGANTEIYAAKVIDPDAIVQKDDAEIVSADFPESLSVGEKRKAEIQVKNTGTTTWTSGDEYALAAVGEEDPFSETLRIPVPSTTSVEPGDTIVFTIDLSAPYSVGSFTSDWRMVKSTDGWFGATASEIVDVTFPSTWFFPVGRSGTIDSVVAEEIIWLFNPGNVDADVTLTVIDEGGNSHSTSLNIAAHSQDTFTISSLVSNVRAAVYITQTSGTSVFPVRRLRWTDNGIPNIAGSLSLGHHISSDIWYLPEVRTDAHITDLLCVYNHTNDSATVSFQMIPNAGSSITFQRELQPKTFQRVSLSELPVNQRYACIVESINDVPVVVEHERLADAGSWDNAVGTAGFAAPCLSQKYYFAEGSTVGFDESIVVFNPGAESLQLSVSVFTTFGEPRAYSYTLDALNRLNLDVSSLAISPALAMSLETTNGVPFVTERLMSWSVSGLLNAAAHAERGNSVPATTWYLPVAGMADTDDYIMLLNPGTVDAQITLTIYDAISRSQILDYSVPARRRRTIYVDEIDFCRNANVAGVIKSNAVPIVVGYSCYWTTGDYFWIDGGSYTGFPLQD